MNVEGVEVVGMSGLPADASRPVSSVQMLAAWELIVRRPEAVTLADIAEFKPFHPEALI